MRRIFGKSLEENFEKNLEKSYEENLEENLEETLRLTEADSRRTLGNLEAHLRHT